MKSFVKHVLSHAAAAACLLSIASGAQAAVVYRITDIGDLFGGANMSRAYDINNVGQVVGYSSATAGDRAFIWNSLTQMRFMSELTNTDSRAYSINDAGQVTGEYGPQGDMRAFLWGPVPQPDMVGRNGRVTNLGNLNGIGPSMGQGINASGAVAGTAGSDDNARAAVWGEVWGQSNVTAHGLATLRNQSEAQGWDINDNGLVVGTSGNKAFTYDGSTMRDIGALRSGGGFSAAYAVNNSGQVVGQSAGTDGRSAFIWKDGSMLGLGDLVGGGFVSAAYDINAQGQVVGFGTAENPNVVGGSTRRAFVWDATSGMLDLNALIDPTDPLSGRFILTDAQGINDLGQIVGFGRFGGAERAFLLTPVLAPIPEPHQYGMMIAGLGMVGWMVRRRRSAEGRSSAFAT
jgi:probable HAF family extracellular repeat protein